MISVELSDGQLNRRYLVYSTSDRRPKLLQYRKPVEFRCREAGALLVRICNLRDPTKDATAAIDFKNCENGEHVMNCNNERLTLNLNVVGFLPDNAFNISGLKEQADYICDRYPGHRVTLSSGIQVPTSALFMLFRDPEENELATITNLLHIARKRHGVSRLSDAQKIEALSSVVHFCAKKQSPTLEPFFDTARTADGFIGSDIRLAHELAFMVHQCRDLDGTAAILVGTKKDGSFHAGVKVTTSTGTYMMEAGWVMPMRQNVIDGPDGIRQFGNSEFFMVESESESDRTRAVNMPFTNFIELRDNQGPPWKQITRIDKLILGKAMSTVTEMPTIDTHLLKVESSGGAGGQATARFAKNGLERDMTGCRNLRISLRVQAKLHEWTEFIVF